MGISRYKIYIENRVQYELITPLFSKGGEHFELIVARMATVTMPEEFRSRSFVFVILGFGICLRFNKFYNGGK